MDRKKLDMWQETLQKDEAAYAGERGKMDGREALYLGSSSIEALTPGDKTTETPHVRNICSEIIEAQVNSALPAPKVVPRRQKDEKLAKLIEDMLRNELDRMPFEELNDMMERTVPIQGGAAFLVEWDNTKRTHRTVGEVVCSVVHPKQIVPQDGVFTGIEDMDHIILKIPQTKESIFARYGVSVEAESESEPEIKGTDTEGADALVTQYIAYYRNDKGGIGCYSWVNDVELCDMEDYQARRLRRCARCGAYEPLESESVKANVAGMTPDMPVPEADIEAEAARLAREQKPVSGKRGAKACPFCGGTVFRESEEDFQEVVSPVERSDGTVIPQGSFIPFYKPRIYPVILQKNVSVFGRFLGDSDIDKIKNQQNSINRVEAKIIDKLMKNGSYITLPDETRIRIDPTDGKIIRLKSPADKASIDVYDMEAPISQDMAFLQQAYEEARQIIGITDSFQGRRDATATSGKAKEFAAAQSAGRLESKRVMKEAAYAALFEAIFKFKLAYADEPRPVVSKDIYGNREYDEFNRYDFLEKDEAGEWCWNDEFLFSCDTSAPLAANREAMWQETRMNLQSGAFGNPQELTTLILFWSKMEMLHYPGAAETKKILEEQLAAQQQAQALAEQQAQMPAYAGGMPGDAAPDASSVPIPGAEENPSELDAGIETTNGEIAFNT